MSNRNVTDASELPDSFIAFEWGYSMRRFDRKKPGDWDEYIFTNDDRRCWKWHDNAGDCSALRWWNEPEVVAEVVWNGQC